MEPRRNRVGARVSTTGQNLDSQTDALIAAGCTKIFSDKASGAKESRLQWDRLLEYLRRGDTLVVTELSRMTRSLMHMLNTVKVLEERGISLVSLRENLDTTTATGRAFVGMIGVVNQLEIELKAERAAAGRAAAKARGKTGRRPKRDSKKLEHARILYENSDLSANEVCKQVGINARSTLFDSNWMVTPISRLGYVPETFDVPPWTRREGDASRIAPIIYSASLLSPLLASQSSN